MKVKDYISCLCSFPLYTSLNTMEVKDELQLAARVVVDVWDKGNWSRRDYTISTWRKTYLAESKIDSEMTWEFGLLGFKV